MSTDEDEDGFSLDCWKNKQEPQCLEINALNRSGWKNKKGTSDRECPICGSWKAHWEKFSRKKFGKCLREGCPNGAEVGAHIINPKVDKEWIVPFCKECNKDPKSFNLEDKITLVRAVECK